MPDGITRSVYIDLSGGINMKKKIISILLAASILPCVNAFASDMYATRGEVADMLLTAADDYNPGVKRSDIIKGYGGDGELHEDWNINRAEALVMLSRAFGKLPALSGHNARVALKSGVFTDIPDWAKPELLPVLDAGIAAGTAEGIFSPYDDVTKEQMNLFIERAYALFGTNEKDDFYAAVNKDALNTLELKPGRVMAGTIYDLGDKSIADVSEILTDIASKEYEKGTVEQKICDFYNSILDMDARNKAGIEPIRPYLEAVDKAKSISDLIDLEKTLMDEICVSPFMIFGLTVDLKDSTKYMLTFNAAGPNMNKDFYTTCTDEQKTAYLDYITKLFALGNTEMNVSEDDLFEFEKKLAENQMNVEDMGDVDKIYNVFTFDEISAMFPGVDMEKILAASRLKKEDRIIIRDPESVKAYAAEFKEENIDLLKNQAKLAILMGYGGALNAEFTEASNEFNERFFGVQGAYSDEEIAAEVTQRYMSEYIGKIYADRYFSEEAKENVRKMVEDIIAVYRERIDALDWMSDATKEKAKNKLDKMGIKIGYPDTWETPLDDIEIKSVGDGGSYFSNVVAMSRGLLNDGAKKQGMAVDKTKWLMYPFTANACYSATSNDITFPAAFLQSPLYDMHASYEENLGCIGYIIAHEITHAFDNNGAKFDEYGNAADWWTAEDYAAFEKLCEKVKYFYDGRESVPGVAMNGELTLSENVADLGAVSCVTEVASRLEHPDYKALYTGMARTWASTKTREYAQYAKGIDVHSDDKLRVNRTIVNCDKFYDAFGITENDGMYVPPEERVKIW